jgi:signal transduction histidine kinase
MADNKKMRRQYYVKDFQLKFVVRFCVLIIFGAIIMGSIIYLLSLDTTTTVFENSRFIIKSTSEFILPLIIFSTVIMTVLVGIISVFVMIMLTHKIAGPLIRFEKYVDKMKDGDISGIICLRASDEIKMLASKFNNMTSVFSEKIDSIKRQMERLTAIEIELKQNNLKKEDIQKRLDEIFDIKQKIEQQLNYFKTT